MDSLTPKEKAALEIFKEKVQDVVDSFEDEYFKHDLNLMRYLRARDLNVAKAEEMLRKNVKWREENHMDKILEKEVSQHMLEKFPMYVSGYDKAGSYVQIAPMGKYDYKKMLDEGRKEEFMQFMFQGVERGLQMFKLQTERSGVYVNQAFMIADFEGMSLKQFMSSDVMQFQKELMLVAEDNYPEFVKTNVVVNAPSIFEFVFNVAKHIMSKAMIAKFRICGSNSAVWRQQLRESIEPDNLPSQYGGSNTSAVYYHPDQGIDFTPKLVTLEESEMVTETVAAAQKLEVKVQVPEGTSKLVWNFKTVDYDIGFSLHKEQESVQTDGDSEKTAPLEENIFEVAKCDSHIVLQKGVLERPESGIYVLTFDNSFSKFRSKQISYIVKVLSDAKDAAAS